MKIGIMTFHDSHNCGSMLQAYALQQYLSSQLGIESEIIDYSNESQRKMYSIVYKPVSIKELIRNILNIFFLKPLMRHKNDYLEFSNKYFIKSEKKYTNKQDLANENFDYTHLIAGSDQVWNTHAKDFDDCYMLSFANKENKIAYAVSLGATDLTLEPEVKTYKTLINEFEFISVREQNAQTWVQSLYNKGNVDICVDPTLLLESKEWMPLVGKREVKEKYIFWYAMTYKKDVLKIVKSISKKLNMPVYIIDAKEWSRRGLFLHNIKLAHAGGPSSFLSLIYNAEIVLTSSFHGTIFSYMFKKKFWYININDKPTKDDRASFLLKQLGLTDRYVTKKEIESMNLMEDISFSDDAEIFKDIDVSKQFLENALLS